MKHALVRTISFGANFRYRGKDRGPRFNSAFADTLHCSPQIIQREVFITHRHEHHRGRTPTYDFRNLGNGSSGIQHPGDRRVPSIVEAANQGLNLFSGVRFFRLAFQNLGCP